jgi:hypothetical protein
MPKILQIAQFAQNNKNRTVSLFGTYVLEVMLKGKDVPIAVIIERRLTDTIEVFVFALQEMLTGEDSKNLHNEIFVKSKQNTGASIFLDNFSLTSSCTYLYGKVTEVESSILNRACSNIEKRVGEHMLKLARIFLQRNGDAVIQAEIIPL